MKRTSLLVIGAICVAAAPLAAPAQHGRLPPTTDQELARSLFREFVELRTTHDVGSTELAQAIRSHLLTAGFPASDVIFIAPPEHPTKGNVVVRYRGKGTSKPVLFLGHLDVVEARAEDWSVEPFKLNGTAGSTGAEPST